AELAERSETAGIGDAAAVVQRLADAIPKSTTLNAVLPLRARILQGDGLTKAIDDEFKRRDEFVVKDAIVSAVRQKRQVTAALFVTAILSVFFVLKTRRRLKARIEADIAVERKRRAELETVSIRFGVATRAARAGVYELQMAGSGVWWSDTMHELYAQSPQTFQPTLASWLELIHPDDRESAQAAQTAAMRERSQLQSQYRIVRPDGLVRHITSLAAVSTDSVDASPRLVGIDLDVTERVEAYEREQKLQQQLRVASRRAGMAEIATNVLHNVGNVLNNVNVSASLVTDAIKKSRAAGLSKVVALVQEHESDLGTFVSSDARGKHLPAYLAELSENLKLEQSTTLQELDALRKNIDHIKDIVAMQQSYAKLVGAPETVAVSSLVEDSLRMNAGAFSRHGVSLERQFEDVPDIIVEKHKVLQILINLLRNAKYACDASGKNDKRVSVRISNNGHGVRIAVTDNGVGIQPEHMSQIFSHGFTTKKDGHGFGLHSGALAAKELGGALRGDSVGPDQGATFTLDLPRKPPEIIYG
ncbi:MAG: ATP-binding protein, partial [Steroidobacteraceae bacterium]